jgi:hypothetical protein
MGNEADIVPPIAQRGTKSDQRLDVATGAQGQDRDPHRVTPSSERESRGHKTQILTAAIQLQKGSSPKWRGAMAELGHEDQFRSLRLSACYMIRQESFAGTHGNGRGAPIPAARGPTMEP